VTALAPTLQAFFTERLTRDKNASPHTIACYRDTLRLLLVFLAERIGTAPAQARIEDLDAPLIGAFLDHLERHRANSVRSRNTRLAAVHSLFRFAALRHPEQAALIARVLAIPPKRHDRSVVSFLDPEEITALLATPDTSRWLGRRDHTLLLVAIQTGLRVSELTGLRCRDMHGGVSGAGMSGCCERHRSCGSTPLSVVARTLVSMTRAALLPRRIPTRPGADQWTVGRPSRRRAERRADCRHRSPAVRASSGLAQDAREERTGGWRSLGDVGVVAGRP
jgi:integrase/recombinase XerD